MSSSAAKTLTREGLAALIEELVAAQIEVVAPALIGPHTQATAYRPIRNLEEAQPEPFIPSRSLKEYFLPPEETLFRFQQQKQEIRLEEGMAVAQPRVILFARPCDAAALEIVDQVMDWDYRDEPWFTRRQATVIIGLACQGGDSSCFCSAVGLSPDNGRGSDILLIPLGNDFAVEAQTEKGQEFLRLHPSQFGDGASAETVAESRRILPVHAAERQLPRTETLQAWLDGHFSSDLWSRIAWKCHGCGACASVCPTCHCFDIVDEMEGPCSGSRRRHWDTCQTCKFTLHASGHNPRQDQNSRIRQRLMHKFFIYPARFGKILCTGCGRCSRACPGGMDLLEILWQAEEAAAQGKTREGTP